MKNKTFHKRKILVVFAGAFAMIFVLIGRLTYLMVFDAEYYQKKAEDLHERERDIKAARGEILDRNGKVLATNRTVCTISVIHSQIREAETVIDNLSELLEMNSSEVRKRVEKISSIERIKSNVDKKTGDKIRNLGMAGVKVDEDFKRFYPYDALASKVLGFTGADNQGIIGLEVKYDKYLKGVDGKILTTTDARGIELDGVAEDRKEPVAGNTLKISLDYNIQMYAQQMAEKVMEEKQAEKVGVVQNILFEVNIGAEESKSGFTPAEAAALAARMADFPHVALKGLMAIPPVSEFPGENCRYFAEMRNLFVDIRAKKYDNVSMECLSMGMSDDFTDAIAEGSTMVRIGTAIFGKRNYNV